MTDTAMLVMLVLLRSSVTSAPSVSFLSGVAVPLSPRREPAHHSPDSRASPGSLKGVVFLADASQGLARGTWKIWGSREGKLPALVEVVCWNSATLAGFLSRCVAELLLRLLRLF